MPGFPSTPVLAPTVLAIDAAHRAPDPVTALNDWQRAAATRWEETGDPTCSPLVWAAFTTTWAPPRRGLGTGRGPGRPDVPRQKGMRTCFGSRDEALYARMRELEGRVERLTNLLGNPSDDDERYPRLHEPAERTDGALRSLEARATSAGIGRPRFQSALDTVYRAETFGHVAVYFVGGRTARVRLLVGPQSPPTTSVGCANSGSGINSDIGGLVRPGEFRVDATHRPGMRAGFECVFTPLF